MLDYPCRGTLAEAEPEEHDQNVPEHTNKGEATKQEDGCHEKVEYKTEEHEDVDHRAYGWWMGGDECEGLGEPGGGGRCWHAACE